MSKMLLADDHQLLRQALRGALEEAGHEVVDEAGDGEEAILLADKYAPEVMVMDVSMPVLSGLDATKIIHERHPDIKILVLTMHGEPEVVGQAIDAGAVAFLTKDTSLREVVNTVEQIASGEVLLSRELAASMLGAFGGASQAESPLTPREEEILQLIADGRSTSEIAADLFISAKTVKNHLASIYEKLGAHDRTQAVLSAVKSGIIQLR